jgi:23S rRNA G2445 N2-methylase RlmL
MSIDQTTIWGICRGDKPARPSAGREADLKLFVTMFKDDVKVFRDVSGASLHKRGYRGVIHKAGLNEAAAAGILYMADWPAIAAQGAHFISHHLPD